MLKKEQKEIKNKIFWKENKNELIKTYPEKAKQITEAYRGGRVQIFNQINENEKVTELDINSLYPYALANMDFPQLDTLKIQYRPLTEHGLTIEEVVARIGVTKCMLYNENNNIGLLQIRTKYGRHYPKTGKYLIGTWTNIELKNPLRTKKRQSPMIKTNSQYRPIS